MDRSEKDFERAIFSYLAGNGYVCRGASACDRASCLDPEAPGESSAFAGARLFAPDNFVVGVTTAATMWHLTCLGNNPLRAR